MYSSTSSSLLSPSSERKISSKIVATPLPRPFSRPFLAEESSIFRRVRTKRRVWVRIFTTGSTTVEATFTARVFSCSPGDAEGPRARAFQVLSGVFVLPAPLAPALVKLFSFSSLSSRRRACVAPDAADAPHSTHERAPDDAACDETKSKPGGIYRERRQRYKNSRKKAWKKRWGQTHGR